MFSGPIHDAIPAKDHNWMFRRQQPQANGGNKDRHRETPEEYTERMKAKYAVKPVVEDDTPATS